MVIFLATAPWAATTLGSLVYGSELHTEHVQMAQRHPVNATVTGPASEPFRSTVQTLKVSWRDPQGTLRTALAVLMSAYRLLRRRLDRSRYRLWDAGWAWADIKWGQRGNRPEQG